MKVVIDTNVFVSSFFGGVPRSVIDLWKTGEITLCLSQSILDEYVDVLRRVGLKDEKELEELLTLIRSGLNISYTSKTPTIKAVRNDPSDDKFIECAVALKASVVISGDKALLDVHEYLGIKIMNPRQFMQDRRS